ncbi:MAG TPA: biopolymer transporter ExbD [Gammaproteobacteria bacterium]|nr:biopolymer transporter ExbD [Gammaproteobacteria bacterium]
MKNLRRIKRMTRSKRNKPPSLNLVSMMDIFTILVFFLLVNQSSSEELPSPDIIKLPDSISEQKPEQTIVLLITPDQILMNGEIIVTASEALAGEDAIIAAVRDRLQEEAAKMISQTGAASERARQVVIMGDRSIPFKFLKKVMASCTAAGYEKISLAVQQLDAKVS